MRSLDEVLKHLREEVYTRVQVSKIHGIGVFAIRDIPQGIDPFFEEKQKLEFIGINAAAIENDPGIPEGVKQYVRDVCSNKNGVRNFPVAGFNSITTAFLMNHSDSPNMGHDANNYSVTLRPIKQGEELTQDYMIFNDSSELLFE